MKFYTQIFLTGLLTVTFVQAFEQDLRPYENQITKIQEITGVHNYTLRLACAQQHPIVTYAPSNFAESQDSSVHRYLLPNTTVSEELQNESACVQQNGSHVEILLFGDLILQTTADDAVVFVTTR